MANHGRCLSCNARVFICGNKEKKERQATKSGRLATQPVPYDRPSKHQKEHLGTSSVFRPQQGTTYLLDGRVLAHNTNYLNHAVYISGFMTEIMMLSKYIFSFFAGICLSESWNLLAYSGMFCRGYARPRTRESERLHTVESAPSRTTGKTGINGEKMRCFFFAWLLPRPT